MSEPEYTASSPTSGAAAAATHAAGGAAQLVASSGEGAGKQSTCSLAPCAPGDADAPVAGLAAALSMHPARPVSAGRGTWAVAGGGGEPALGLAQQPPASPSLPVVGGGAASADAGPAEPVGDDGAALSAEAAASPFCPPASERHAAFLKLVDHKLKAGLQNRAMRDADFSNLAAEAGGPLFGGDSLIVASLRVSQAVALICQCIHEAQRGPAGAVEAEALRWRAWVVLLAQALPIIQSRIDKGTLLPGKLRKVEEAYEVYKTRVVWRALERPVPSAAELHAKAPAFGFETAVQATRTALTLLPVHPWRLDQRVRVQALVLATLRLIPKTASMGFVIYSEHFLVDVIECGMNPVEYGVDFCESVLAVWRSRAVADVLRSRGSLQGHVAETAAIRAEYVARQKADVAKKGLRACALPACGKQETTVLQFRVCGHCQATRYCCPEHAKQHWKVHKREYEEAGEAEAGAGGAAA